MLQAIIFDCDGVIANTEPLHMAALQRVLAEESIPLSREEYYSDFLAYDDRGALRKAFAKHGRALDDAELSRLSQRKAAMMEPIMNEGLEVFPGIAEFVTAAALSYPIAVASGAIRHEVELILRHAGIYERFAAIVAAEDVRNGKPDPEAFLEALSRINRKCSASINPGDCLVIEDSVPGVSAARSAGMICLAVTNSYPRSMLAEAHLVIDSFAGLSIAAVKGMLSVA
jgi:HAD superfamily hydrolase (TIGR01509 family)